MPIFGSVCNTLDKPLTELLELDLISCFKYLMFDRARIVEGNYFLVVRAKCKNSIMMIDSEIKYSQFWFITNLFIKLLSLNQICFPTFYKGRQL